MPETTERTLAIIKPDAVKRRLVGRIVSRIETAGFRIVGMRMQRLTRAEAAGFYAVHAKQGFYKSLVAFMSSGPCVVMVLEGDNAIKRWRALMGATNPSDAGPDTIRRDFGTSIGRNATHGSDGRKTAAFEVGYFFAGCDLIG